MNEEVLQPAEDPPDQERGLQRIVRLQYMFGGLNAVNWTLCLGAPLILLATEWGANPLQIGILASFVYIFSPVQIVANVLLGKLGCKRTMLSGWTARTMFIVPVPLMLLIWGTEEGVWKVYVMTISLGFFGLLRSIGLTAQMPWTYGLIPEPYRGRFFSGYMMVVNISGAGVFLLSALILHWFSSLLAFSVIFWSALIAGFIAASVLSRLPDVEKPASLSLTEIRQLCWQFTRLPGVFRRTTLVWISYFAFAAPLVPFLIYYVSKEGILSSDEAMFMALLNYMGGIVGSWFSRSWLDLLGIRFLSAVALGGLAGVMLVLAGLIGGAYLNGAPIHGMGLAMIISVFVMGAFQSVFYTISMKMQPFITQEKTRALQVSIFYASGTFFAGISSMLWGALMRLPSASGGNVNLHFLLLYVMLSCVLFMVGSVFMARLPIQEVVPRPMNFFARVFRKK